jgi:Tol biopolymer transport system component
MLAFIRGPNTFITAGDVYTMLLPNGEPVALTRDEKLKIAPAFSTDDAHIAYTVFDTTRNAFDTWMVPALGGEPRLLFPNTTGLSWIPGQRILFSEVLSGMHMALSTSAADRSKVRHIYVPRHERGMAHFSYLSPDGKWVLLVEMDHNGDWMPCRVVPFDGNSEGRQVGPTGKCTAGAWSPDGRWIYLSVAVGGDFHIWRQRWASGQQEQITFGPTEEEGIAIAPDGRSLITSIGMRQSAIWMHDASGDREISSDGFASSPAFSSDGATLYWLRRESVAANAELWAMNLGSGTVGPALPGIAMDSYDVSADGKRVAFATSAGSGKSQIWLAPLDRLEPPKRIVSSRADTPFFSSPADLVFRLIEEKASFLEKTTVPGQTGKRIIPGTIIFLYSVSPDGLWAAARIPKDGENTNIAAVAVPLQGGPLAPIGNLAGWVTWAPDESSLYISEVSGKKSNRTLVLPISHGKALPELPPGGLRSFDEGVALPRARVIDQSSVAPSVDPSMYAYTKTSVHRNLFRIPLP